MDFATRHVSNHRLRTVAGAFAALIAAATLVGSTAGCGDEPPDQPPSLDTPTAIATALRDHCGEGAPAFGRFNDQEGCAIGLIANAGTNRLAIADLGRRQPQLRDLDSSVPGLSYIEVGRRPIDVAASPDGTAAYTLNSVGGDLSVVDLWRLERVDTAETPIPVPGQPIAMTSAPSGGPAGTIAVATHAPNALWIRDGVVCEEISDKPHCTDLEAEATQIPLPGRPADIETSVDGSVAYVVYDDRDYMSVVALPDNADVLDREGFACRGGRTGVPCEAKRIGLSYGCSDGVDSDGDGLADQDDPQCWGPLDGESADGVSRRYTGICGDGLDNDDDGAVDRDDAGCQLASDDSESEVIDPDAVFPCSDGEDNDGDGLEDYPDDPNCYGPTGRRETPVEATGFDAIAAGEGGTFLYVVDGANSQVLTVDVRRSQLIDAARTTTPHGAPFTDNLGISVGRRPTGAAGFVTRNVAWTDPDDPSHGIIEYNFGAYVASNNGRTFVVRTVSSDCEVTETERDSLLSRREFERGSEAFRQSNERHCLQLPEFPLTPDAQQGEENPCQAAEMCRGCLDAEPDDMADGCTDVCADFEENRRQCRVQGRRLQPNENVDLVVNPYFAPADADGPEGRLIGTGTCSEPATFIERMRNYTADNPDAPQAFGCGSSLRDQPLERFATEEQLQQDAFDDLERADLLQFTTLQLVPPDDGGGVSTEIAERPYDFRYRDEDWTATWEGVIPRTNRDDGLLAEEEPGRLLTEPLDLCEAGVEAGDRIIIRNTPTTGSDAPDRCDDLVPEGDGGGDSDIAEDDDPFLTYRVEEVLPNALQMAPLEADGHADTLPTRGCFPTGIRYRIRPEDEWVVVGERSGFQSARTSALGQCVPTFGAESARTDGRVASGDVFVGPYFDFLLYEGPVDPVRRQDAPYSFTFGTQRFFTSRRFPTETVLPSDVLLTPRLNGGAKLMVSDASSDFIWIRNLRHPDDDPVILQ